MIKSQSQILREYMDSFGAAPEVEVQPVVVAPIPQIPSTFDADAIVTISSQLNPLLADVFALYMKTKNFHWHMRGAHFRDYHLMLDEHSDQIYAITDALAERVRKIGGYTLKSIGDIARQQRIVDNDEELVAPADMLMELRDNNLILVSFMMQAHSVCEQYSDVATCSLLEVWIDEAERRAWFLSEAVAQ